MRKKGGNVPFLNIQGCESGYTLCYNQVPQMRFQPNNCAFSFYYRLTNPQPSSGQKTVTPKHTENMLTLNT